MSEIETQVGEEVIEVKPKKAKKKAAKAKTKPSANGKAKGEKKMSALDAAFKILKGRSTPMNCKELIEAMEQRKLWKSPGGATPHATLAAGLLTEITKKGKEARFKKVAPGQFAAK